MQLPPVLRDLYSDRHPFIVVQKGAQAGISEWMVNQVLWAADTLLGGRGNALYVMPTEAVMRDFVQARVDSAIAASAHLSARVHPELPVRAVDRTGLKRFGEAHAYFRGSDRGQLITVDADIVLLDEFDRMDPETLALAQQRIASSRLGWLRAASTPSAPETGINRLFLESDQRHYLLPCPGCGLEQALTLDNLDAERVLLACSSCGSELDLWAEGRWEAAAPSNGAVHGYHLPRLYSPWANLEQIVHGAESHSLVEEQQFQNQVMGEVFRPEGGNLTEADIERCVQPYAFRDYRRQECLMGVDVGKVLHVVIREKVDPRRLWHLAELGDFVELGPLFERFNVVRCVIDAYPELHTAEEFARESRGKVWLAYYDRQAPGHHRERGRDGAPNRVHINRSQALDGLTRRVINQEVALPAGAHQLGLGARGRPGEYYRQLLSTPRSLEQDAAGNWVPLWLKPGKADHYLHAELYAMLAEEGNDGARPGRMVSVSLRG